MEFNLEIVQPIYNPRDNWVERYITRYNEMKELFAGECIRIIFVNDGSIRNFDTQIIQELQNKIEYVQIISYAQNKGKGYAVREGVKQTNAPFVLYTDYDFPYKMVCLYKAYQQLKAGNDVVVGIRDEEYYSHLGYRRKLVSKACNFLNKTFLKIPHTDTQSGLKGFSSKGKELMLKTTINQFLFDTEFVCRAYQGSHIKVSTIDVDLREGVKFTRMSLKTILTESKNFISILTRSYFGKLRS